MLLAPESCDRRDVVRERAVIQEKPAVGHASPYQLALKLACNHAGKTILQHRYMAYPLSISPIFRLEANGAVAASQRAYLYRMNTSPGLLADDAIGVSLQLAAGSQLYLADQSAMKVHTMPQTDTQATLTYDIELAAEATLEFLPEPLILFADAALTQTTEITLHPTAGLSWGEIILPGRLARGEVYAFRHYRNRMRVKSPAQKLWFVESMNLLGKDNRFAATDLFAGRSGRSVLGTLVLVLPEAIASASNLSQLEAEIETLAEQTAGAVALASSTLPGDRGLFVRAISSTTRELHACFKAALNCVRRLRNQAQLPYSL
ncbi:MAG: urease accessory protein UreD [Phormidesmis sp. RL_2_1]|nr:urease accessory protein UreD [Phormidesmis sp. RL_2_1]